MEANLGIALLQKKKGERKEWCVGGDLSIHNSHPPFACFLFSRLCVSWGALCYRGGWGVSYKGSFLKPPSTRLLFILFPVPDSCFLLFFIPPPPRSHGRRVRLCDDVARQSQRRRKGKKMLLLLLLRLGLVTRCFGEGEGEEVPRGVGGNDPGMEFSIHFTGSF